MPQLRPCLFKAILLTSLITLAGCSGSRVYEDTKGWGIGVWEGIKAGSKQASDATKEAMDSVTNSPEKADENTSEIETSKIEPVKTPTGKTSTPTPLKASEKMAQPPGVKIKGSYAVHLSSNKSKKSAEQEWVELKNAFPKETRGLQLRLKPVNITGKGTFYRVLGSSYETKASADKACEKFKQKKQYCMAIKL